MRKLIALILAFVCVLGLTGCSVSWTDKDIKNTHSIEITSYSSNGDLSEVYTVSDHREVDNICNTFSLLELRKIKLTEPTLRSYEISFLDIAGREIENVSLLFGHNVIESNGQIYKITDESDINRYIKDIVSKNTQ